MTWALHDTLGYTGKPSPISPGIDDRSDRPLALGRNGPLVGDDQGEADG